MGTTVVTISDHSLNKFLRHERKHLPILRLLPSDNYTRPQAITLSRQTDGNYQPVLIAGQHWVDAQFARSQSGEAPRWLLMRSDQITGLVYNIQPTDMTGLYQNQYNTTSLDLDI